jgi:hypothetical protein
LLGLTTTFVQACFITALRSSYHKVCRNGIFTILPFIISNNTHIQGRTHTYTHAHTHTNPDIQTHVILNQHKRKNEAMSREHAIMCREKQEFFSKPKMRNKLFLQESRPQISPGQMAPDPCNNQAARTKDNQKKPHSPAPYSVVSAVSPVNAPLAIVLIWFLDKSLQRQTTA